MRENKAWLEEDRGEQGQLYGEEGVLFNSERRKKATSSQAHTRLPHAHTHTRVVTRGPRFAPTVHFSTEKGNKQCIKSFKRDLVLFGIRMRQVISDVPGLPGRDSVGF